MPHDPRITTDGTPGARPDHRSSGPAPTTDRGSGVDGGRDGGTRPLVVAPAGSPGTELSWEAGGTLARRSVLPGGVRVLTEQVPGQRSVALGAWIAVGARDETGGHLGSTHVLEHLLFKGTARRSALDIAEAFDAVGGESNAATGQESTCYHARVLDDDAPLALDVITDMITSATLDADELENERGVILDELAAAEDDAQDVAHERFATAVLGGHPLGRPVGGTPESVRALPRDVVAEHYRSYYRSDELVLTAAGSLDHDELCERLTELLGRGGWELDASAAPAPRRSAHDPTRGRPVTSDAGSERAGSEPTGQPRAVTVVRATEQAHVVIGAPALRAGDPRRWALALATTILGGGMSSRLFQEVRERRGLAYSTYAWSTSYAEAGYAGLYAGCAPDAVPEVARLLAGTLADLAGDGPAEAELARAKGQLRGGIVLGLEDSGARMSRLGNAEIVRGELTSIDATIELIDAVTARDVADMAAFIAAGDRAATVVGPVAPDAADGLLG
ncbi:M16 family metallopeptidase [Georgenia sp. Z1491]|uniref:M16 family metallopeptidase n=1 Tax=Georgenia sp. Z1491 TaxID=3416707 RepID=UPI003CF5AC91